MNQLRHFITLLFLLFITSAASALESKLLQEQITSKLVPSPTDIQVLLPPQYSNEGERLPLLILLHGAGGSSNILQGTHPLFKYAWASKSLPPLVVVSFSAQRSMYMDYKDKRERWESFVIKELLPLVRNRYHISSKPQETLITGYSMGGLGALRLAFKYPDTFGAVAAMAPAIEPALSFDQIQHGDRFYRPDKLYEEKFGNPVDQTYWRTNHPLVIAKENIERLQASTLEIYFEVGDKDELNLFRGAEALHRILYDGQVKHEYHLLREETHQLNKKRFLSALEFLGKTLTRPSP